MHDLDLYWPDGRVEAMEVTSASSHAVEAMKAAANDLRKPYRGMVEAVKVRRCWLVTLAPQQSSQQVGRQLAEIHSQLDERLAQLEAAGMWSFHRWSTDYHSEPGQALSKLGVVTAFGLPADPDSGIFLVPPHPEEIEPASSKLLNDEIEANANANADKLGRSGCQERHLFVWVGQLHPLWTLFESLLLEEGWDLLPPSPPNLPPEVTTAWAATEIFDTVLWRVKPPAPWEEIFRAPR
jgi:hypothetical protein